MSIDSRRASQDLRPASVMTGGEKRVSMPSDVRESALFPPVEELPEPTNGTIDHPPIPITVTPASPMVHSPAYSQDQLNGDHRNSKDTGSSEKQRLSVDTNRGKGKKVREVFISGVHKGRARVTTISKKIGHNVGRHNSMHLKRSRSAPGVSDPLHSHKHSILRGHGRLPCTFGTDAVPGIVHTSTATPEHLCLANRPLVC